MALLVSPSLQSGRLDEENIRVKVLLETFHISAPISSQFIQLLVELKAIPVINILGPSSHSTQGNCKNYERVGDAMVLPIDMSPLENPMISDPFLAALMNQIFQKGVVSGLQGKLSSLSVKNKAND